MRGEGCVYARSSFYLYCVCGKTGDRVEALQKVTSGDAPIFVKGRRENPESSIVEIMPFFVAGLCGCETYIAAACSNGKQRDLVPFLALYRKRWQPAMPYACSIHGICRMTTGALSALSKPRDVVGRETFFGHF